MKLTSKLQRELARQFAQVSILERAVIGMADVLPLSDSEILRFTNLLAKKTLSAQRKEREAVRNRINSIRASGTEAAEDVLPRMRTLPSNPPKTKPTQADFVAWAKEMTGADEPTLEEQVAVDPNGKIVSVQ